MTTRNIVQRGRTLLEARKKKFTYDDTDLQDLKETMLPKVALAAAKAAADVVIKAKRLPPNVAKDLLAGVAMDLETDIENALDNEFSHWIDSLESELRSCLEDNDLMSED